MGGQAAGRAAAKTACEPGVLSSHSHTFLPGWRVFLAAALFVLTVMMACSPASETARTPTPTGNANGGARSAHAAPSPAAYPTPPLAATTTPAARAPATAIAPTAIPPTTGPPTVAPPASPAPTTPAASPTPSSLEQAAGSCGNLCSEEFWAAGATVESVRGELDRGADPTGTNEDGTPALAFAAGSCANPGIVRLLLEAGADLDAVDDYSGFVPLHLAAMVSAYAVDPEIESPCPGDAADLAESAVRVIELLLKHGADAGARDHYGQSGLFLYLATLVEQSSNAGWSHDPALRPDIRVVELLLSQGGGIEAESETDAYLLDYAMLVRSGPEVIELLLDHGAGDAAVALGQEGNALHLAATYNAEPQVLRMLLERGEDVAATGANGFTALHLAVRVGDTGPEAVRALLEGGADVNATDDDGGAALHHAASHSGPEIVGLLLERDADVDARDHLMNTPLHAAVSGGYNSGDAPRMADPEVVRLLLEAGAEVKARNAAGAAPLHSAALYQDAVAARLLVAGGGDVNAADDLGNTPLHLAARMRESWSQLPEVDAEFVRLLVELGAEVSARNHAGETACDLARTQDPDLRALLC